MTTPILYKVVEVHPIFGRTVIQVCGSFNDARQYTDKAADLAEAPCIFEIEKHVADAPVAIVYRTW